MRILLLLLFTILPTLNASSAEDNIEPANRVVFSFNQTADYVMMSPLSSAYGEAPLLFRHGVTNFFTNLQEPLVLFQDIVLLSPSESVKTATRFFINSTLGIGGLMDIGASLGLPKRSHDIGRAISSYGIGSGSYLVLPLSGPSTVRDSIDYWAALAVDSIYYASIFSSPFIAAPVAVLKILDLRYASDAAIKSVSELSLDPYVFSKGAYLQKRCYKTGEDCVADDFEEDDF